MVPIDYQGKNADGDPIQGKQQQPFGVYWEGKIKSCDNPNAPVVVMINDFAGQAPAIDTLSKNKEQDYHYKKTA